jgi:hypothetical protein
MAGGNRPVTGGAPAAGANVAEPWRPLAVIRAARPATPGSCDGENPMHGLIYLVGLVVVIMAILSFFGLR